MAFVLMMENVAQAAHVDCLAARRANIEMLALIRGLWPDDRAGAPVQSFAIINHGRLNVAGGDSIRPDA